MHERLHGAAPFAALAEGRLDRGGYAALLGRLLAFHRAVAPAVERGQAALGDALPDGNRRRIDRLEADLAYVGRLSVPTMAQPAWGDADGYAVGCLYVVEGSALGGKVIHRQLDYLFGDGEPGRSFFGGDKDQGRRWRELCAGLDDFADGAGALEAMSRGALATFALFEACLGEA